MEYPVPLREPAELMDIFAQLEEKNLQLIKQCQEHDQMLEQKK